MEKENKFVIIDGSSLMCVAYYGNLPNEVKYAKTEEEKEYANQFVEQNSKGIYINGLRSFITTLLNILENQDPSHLAVCFDESRETTFRKKIYPDYKAQRTPTPEPLQKQMQNIRIFLKAVGIPVLLSPEYEADDYAGSLCKTFESPDMPVRLFTKDRDYLQLISPYTKVWLMTHSEEKYLQLSDRHGHQTGIPFGCYEFDEQVVYDEFGLHPSQITDWKGISGDSSDNLPGIKGVSDKNAIPLIRHYGSLEGITSAVSDMKERNKTDVLKSFWKTCLGLSRPPVELIWDQREEGALCKMLATIKTDLNVGKLEDYESCVNFQMMRALLQKLELDELIPRVDAQIRFAHLMEESEAVLSQEEEMEER